jgi:predicted transcriptional regulator
MKKLKPLDKTETNEILDTIKRIGPLFYKGEYYIHDLFRNTNAAVVFCHLQNNCIRHARNNKDNLDGWVYATVENMEYKLRISSRTISRILSKLVNANLIMIKKEYVGFKYRNYYKINNGLCNKLVEEYSLAWELLKKNKVKNTQENMDKICPLMVETRRRFEKEDKVIKDKRILKLVGS